MEITRKPFQGVSNIIRFNWHFYILAILFFVDLLVLDKYLLVNYHPYILAVIITGLAVMLISLLVSFYVYDLSKLYKFNWLDDDYGKIKVVNINAGFDETSTLLKAKFINAELTVLDFYDPLKHTEVSIKRARNYYPPFAGTKPVSTSNLMQDDGSIDKIFVSLSAHEIRDEKERLIFFKELQRILKPSGQIYITEHLRDIANFVAYNIGFFHFLSRTSWLKAVKSANLIIKSEIKITPFITVFILNKNGVTA